MLIRRQESLADKPAALLTSTACMTTCHQDRLPDIMMASRAIQDQQLEIILIVTTCYQEPQQEIFFSYQRPIVPLRNRNMEIQQHGNVPSGSGTGIGLPARIGPVVTIWFYSGLEVTWGFFLRTIGTGMWGKTLLWNCVAICYRISNVGHRTISGIA